jgi:4-diphosphocytidyl-2-C-methyl-D-erythritol kinase
MSGSGATCFALYDDLAARDAAAQALPPAWWHLAGSLR